MAEDLWATISRYYWNTDKEFTFTNTSTYEWYIFEWFLKREFRKHFLVDVIEEDPASTTDGDKNSEAKNNKRQAQTESRKQSPANRRSYAEATSEKSVAPNTRDLRNRTVVIAETPKF